MIQEDAQKKTNEQWNKRWDEQYADLVKNDKLPKVEEKDNKDDIGLKARRALWSKLYEVNKERAKEGKQPITSLKEIYYEHYEAPDQQPAGFDAPVSLGKKAVSTGDKDSYSYKDIHDSSYEDIVTGKK